MTDVYQDEVYAHGDRTYARIDDARSLTFVVP
jgi:hypothetical protein